MEKLFVVRKYIMAKSASDAIRRDRAHPVDDVWVEEDWKKENMLIAKDVGFGTQKKTVKTKD